MVCFFLVDRLELGGYGLRLARSMTFAAGTGGERTGVNTAGKLKNFEDKIQTRRTDLDDDAWWWLKPDFACCFDPDTSTMPRAASDVDSAQIQINIQRRRRHPHS